MELMAMVNWAVKNITTTNGNSQMRRKKKRNLHDDVSHYCQYPKWVQGLSKIEVKLQ